MKVIVCGQSADMKQCEETLQRIAKKHAVNLKIELMTSGKQLLFRVESKNTDVDLIYLEYTLEDGTGIDAAAALREKEVSADIIFYTTDEQHIAEGYDVGALHYLIRNKISEAKFEAVFLKAAKRAQKRKSEYLSLFCAGESQKIEISRIKYFEVKKRIVTVHFGEQETFEFYSTLSRLEETLYGKGFIRIHQAFLVAERYIQKKTKQTMIMSDQTVLPIGRSYQKKV